MSGTHFLFSSLNETDKPTHTHTFDYRTAEAAKNQFFSGMLKIKFNSLQSVGGWLIHILHRWLQRGRKRETQLSKFLKIKLSPQKNGLRQHYWMFIGFKTCSFLFFLFFFSFSSSFSSLLPLPLLLLLLLLLLFLLFLFLFIQSRTYQLLCTLQAKLTSSCTTYSDRESFWGKISFFLATHHTLSFSFPFLLLFFWPNTKKSLGTHTHTRQIELVPSVFVSCVTLFKIWTDRGSCILGELWLVAAWISLLLLLLLLNLVEIVQQLLCVDPRLPDRPFHRASKSVDWRFRTT